MQIIRLPSGNIDRLINADHDHQKSTSLADLDHEVGIDYSSGLGCGTIKSSVSRSNSQLRRTVFTRP